MATPFSGEGKVKVAVITGGHAYDVVGFNALFRSMPDVDAYIQHMEDFCCDNSEARDRYRVVLFYNMHKEMPTGEEPWPMRERKQAIEHLGEVEQGIFLLHHGILSHQEWPLFQEIVGIEDRTITPHFGERIHVDVADPDHPITRGLEPWEQEDETYEMNSAEEAGGNHILLTTDHPRSMRTLAWTRRHKKSRVFCLELGHDNEAYTNPNFRTVVHRGILWCAGEI